MNRFFSSIYDLSPAFLQNVGVSLYGLKLHFREYGRRFREQLEEFEKLQWLSRSDLEAYQSERLKALVKHAYDNVPYYRGSMASKKLLPEDIRSINDLPKLPILTANHIRNNFNQLIARNFKKSMLSLGHTSGTTGSPLQFLYDRNICLIKNVVDWRQKRWAGINPGDRIAFFLGKMIVPVTRNKPPFWRHNWITNHLLFSSFHMSPEMLDGYVKKLERFRPQGIEGYPSTVYILASFLLSCNKTFPVRAVFTSAETLFPRQRETIKKAFECELFDFYGLAERVAFATECESHEGHHLNMDFGITEILKKDGQRATPGEIGRIVATGLHNYGMPLIRYQTTDVTAIKPKICSCGREFPLMEDVTTKDEDIITTTDGRYISSSILTHPFKPMKGVGESQIIQEDRDHIRIKIVKLPAFKEVDTGYLLDEFRKRVGDDMKIEIEFVESIPRTEAGKFRWVISKVPLEF